MRSNPSALRIAAYKELERRGTLTGTQRIVLERLLDNYVGEETLSEKEPLSLYPRWSVFMFAVLFSPFFAGLLQGRNLYLAGRRDQVLACIATGFLFTMGIAFGLQGGNLQTVSASPWSIFGQVIAAITIDYLFWIRPFGRDLSYQNKLVWKPLLLTIILTLASTFLAIQFGLIALPDPA